MTVKSEELRRLVETMKRASAVLRDAGVPHLLAGGLASWARGGPQTDHDVDFFIKEEDVGRALETLASAGFRTERPPEEWLFKAYDGDVQVDLIFSPSGGPITEEHFERAEEREVQATRMKVLSLEDVLATKLLALSEQEPDFSSVLEIARMLREQLRWDEVRERTSASPFARAFFTLIEGLGIVEPAGAAR